MTVTDLADLQRWVGRTRNVEDQLALFPARALASVLNRRIVPQSGDIVPPAWQWLYFLDTPAGSETGSDGHPQLGPDSFMPPSPLPRRMWAAGNMHIRRPLRFDRTTVRQTRISSIDAKSGKSGSLLFVTLEHQFVQDGEVCITEEQNLVYRDLPSEPRPLPPSEPAPHNADWSEIVLPDSVLLFRYSALTYNAHRIHYDRNYAVSYEQYPALVVQSPLLATLLIEQLSLRYPGSSVVQFRFRALRPSFDGRPITIGAHRDGQRIQLWMADSENVICVSAEAILA